jgi:hypothetical protein
MFEQLDSPKRTEHTITIGWAEMFHLPVGIGCRRT